MTTKVKYRPPYKYPRLANHKHLAKNLRAYKKVYVKDVGCYIAVMQGANPITKKPFFRFFLTPDEKFMEDFLEETAQ